mgnify:CR=1 FL=1
MPTGMSLLTIRHDGAPGAVASSHACDKSHISLASGLFVGGYPATTNIQYEDYPKTLYLQAPSCVTSVLAIAAVIRSKVCFKVREFVPQKLSTQCESFASARFDSRRQDIGAILTSCRCTAGDG